MKCLTLTVLFLLALCTLAYCNTDEQDANIEENEIVSSQNEEDANNEKNELVSSQNEEDTNSEENELVSSQLSIWRKPWRHNKCRFVRCALVWCKNKIPANPARGRCCPSCPKKTKPWICRLVRCQYPKCKYPIRGKCCSYCPGKPSPHKCKRVRCARPRCKYPIPANPAQGKCCSTCPYKPPVWQLPHTCKRVFCLAPRCKYPIPANPARGQCCARCPKSIPSPGTCPAVPRGKKGLCAMLCFTDADCFRGQKCCSNGCGHQCTTVSITHNNVCKLPVVIGRCRARLRRYYFNKYTGKCQLFYYGGCGGNGNNFTSFWACKRKCGRYYKG